MVFSRKLPSLERIPRFQLMASRHKPRRSRTFSNAFKMVSTVAKLARKIGGLRTQRRNNEGPSSAITTQKDSMSIYRRRRAPRKVRLRARNKYKRFIKKQLIAHRDNTNLFNLNLIPASSISEQKLSSFTVGYINANLVGDAGGDWDEAFSNFLNATPSSASKAFYVTGLNYDVTISNVTGATVTVDALACELDVYEYVYRKTKLINGANGLESLLTNTLDNETKLPGATLQMKVVDPGYTPFDSNQALKYIIIKSKQRYYIPRGDSISFVKNIKFNRPIKLTSEDFASTATAVGDFTAKAGLTRGLIFVQKGTPTQDLTSGLVGATQLFISIQIRYRFKVVDLNPNQNAFGT